MSLLAPDARAQRLLSDATPLDDVEATFCAVLEGTADDSEASYAVRTAYEIYQTSARHVLNALILVKTPPARICEDLELTELAYKAYRHLFFDSTVFRTVFTARAYIRNLPPENNEDFKSYEFAMIEGGEALLARYRLGDRTIINEESLATRALAELGSRITEHRGRTLTHPTARASLAAAQAVLAGSSAVRNLRPPRSQAIETAFELALQAQTHSHTPETAPVSPEELIRSAPKPK